MRLEARYSFHLPDDGGLLALRRDDESSVLEFHDGDDVRIVLNLSRSHDGSFGRGPGVVAHDDAETWELWQLSRVEVRVLTEAEPERPDVDLIKDFWSRIQTVVDSRAVRAASKFLQIVRWRTGQFWLPDGVYVRPDDPSVSFYLDDVRVRYSVQHGTVSIATPDRALTADSSATIEDDLRHGRRPPLAEGLLLDSRMYRRRGDHRVALLLAAISIETAMISELRPRLEDARVATTSQIDKFLEEMSNRLLSTVVLGLLDIGDQAFREDCRSVLAKRNRLVHGKRFSASPAEADLAINSAQRMIDILSQ